MSITYRTPTISDLGDIVTSVADINNIILEYIGYPFIITIDAKQITIPYIKSRSGFYIDWGDAIEYVESEASYITHQYNEQSIYTIQITGNITHIDFHDVTQLIELSQWGNVDLYDGRNIFMGCYRLKITAIDKPNLKNVSDLSSMFANCEMLEGDLSQWDVSNISNMSSMFHGCGLFNSDLSKWDVRNVSNMEFMFYKCVRFNSDLSKWDVRNVVYMYDMFNGCKIFNSDLSNWHASQVQDFGNMFYGCESLESKHINWNII
jgi:surface protein